jgi:hypothetical protein
VSRGTFLSAEGCEKIKAWAAVCVPQELWRHNCFGTAHQAQEFRRPEQNAELDGHRHEKSSDIVMLSLSFERRSSGR